MFDNGSPRMRADDTVVFCLPLDDFWVNSGLFLIWRKRKREETSKDGGVPFISSLCLMCDRLWSCRGGLAARRWQRE